MVATDSTTTFVGRLDTFQIAHPLAKRRASSTKKKGPTVASWPHETPSAEELALAGFFYSPKQDSLDNVQCFVCKSQIDGWEAGDNPAFEHLTLSPDCGWAINICIKLRNGDPNRVEDDPMSDKMMESRRSTFLNSWPHEAKKGWKCKTQKMIEAGWCYDPSPDYEDGVTCCYCNLSLDGWEPKDSPLDEHRKRSPDCYFFVLSEQYASLKKSQKGKKTRTSKASRLSIQSNVSAFSEAPSLMSLGEFPAEEGDSVLTTATTATSATVNSMAGKGKKGRAKAAPKGTRKTTRKEKNVEASEMTIVNESSITKDDQMDYQMEEPQPPAPKRNTRRGTKQTDSSIVHSSMIQAVSMMDLNTPPKRATRTKATRGKAKQQANEEESQLQSSMLDVSKQTIDPPAPRATRGTKRASDGTAKMDSSVVVYEEPSVALDTKPPVKAKRGRKPAKKAESPVPRSSEVMEAPSELAESRPKPVPKGRKGKKATKAKEAESLIMEPSLDDFPAPPSSIRREPPAKIRSQTPEAAPATESSPFQPVTNPSPDQVEAEPSMAAITTSNMSPPQSPLSSPSPMQSRSGLRMSSSSLKVTQTPSKPSQPAPSLTPSPSRSDEENVPPSSRPSSNVPIPSSIRQQTPIRMPLAATTPTGSSPSKHANCLPGTLKTAFPWSPTDLEAIFIPSPDTMGRRRRLFESGHPLVEKENRDVESLSLNEIVQLVKLGLTTPERKMTVQDWINHNAQRGEALLRQECEALVAKFEDRGSQALRTLEGIHCVE